MLTNTSQNYPMISCNNCPLIGGMRLAIGNILMQKLAFKENNHVAGSNPTSPYGYPTFLNGLTNDFNKAIQIDQNEAVVLIFRTPPQNRYFGFT